jgi:hypothetical protein
MFLFMAERRYLLMMLVQESPDGTRFWGAAKLEGVGCKLTRDQAEGIAARAGEPVRFLLPANEQTEQFAAEGRPTMGMLPGETIWHYGEPTYVDLCDVLRTVADGAESPAPRDVLLPVESVVRVATERFGEAEAHEVQTHFDRLVLEMGGRREGSPPAYRLDIERVLTAMR